MAVVKYCDLHNRDILYRLYIIEHKSSKDIARIYSCQPSLVRRYLHRYNIQIRSKSEISTDIKRKPYKKHGPNTNKYNNTHKYCAKCKLWLLHDQFGVRTNSITGLYPYCKICDFTKRHNITRADWLILLEGQGGVCAFPNCKSKPTEIDHDHSCCAGKGSCGNCIRGALCSKHNMALGQFADDIDQLKLGILYLENPCRYTRY